MNQREISRAATEIAYEVASNPFSDDFVIARKAARYGIKRGLQAAADAEQFKRAMAQIDEAFERKATLKEIAALGQEFDASDSGRLPKGENAEGG